jgi:hypothetical protein
MKIGFTGTQIGMTPIQSDMVATYLHHAEVHHGDCIGADSQVHFLAKKAGCSIVIHPPIKTYKRFFCPDADKILPARNYPDRNHDIVDCTELLLAAPGQYKEKLRSGTWATIRYAVKCKKPVKIIYPNGTEENL